MTTTAIQKLADAMFADPQHPGWTTLPEQWKKLGRLVSTRSAAQKMLSAIFDVSDVADASDDDLERCLDQMRGALAAIVELADGELRELQQNQR
jgi:hypothetical protein